MGGTNKPSAPVQPVPQQPAYASPHQQQPQYQPQQQQQQQQQPYGQPYYSAQPYAPPPPYAPHGYAQPPVAQPRVPGYQQQQAPPPPQHYQQRAPIQHNPQIQSQPVVGVHNGYPYPPPTNSVSQPALQLPPQHVAATTVTTMTTTTTSGPQISTHAPRFTCSHHVAEEDGKSFVVYEVSIHVHGQQPHVLPGKRYSALLTIHQELEREKHYKDLKYPCSFPKKTWSSHMVKDGDVSARAGAICSYFQSVFTCHHFCGSLSLHESLGVSEEFSAVLIASAADLQREDQKAMDDAQAACDAAKRLQDEEYNGAQHFFKQATDSGCIPVFTLNRAKRFQLQNRVWGAGSANISGDDGRRWFSADRVNRSFFHFSNCKFAIHDMNHNPLIFLQEDFACHAKKFCVNRLYFDPATGKQLMYEICDITRHQGFGRGCYDVEMNHCSRSIDSSLPISVRCRGTWPSEYSFYSVRCQPGMPECEELAAQVSRKYFRLTDTYGIEVMAGHDVCLYLAIAMCLDRMHHEAKH